MNDSGMFSIVTMLYNHHPMQFCNIFITPEENPTPIKQFPPISPSPSPWQPTICILSLGLLFWIFHINGLVPFMSGSFASIMFLRFIYMCQHFIFYVWIMFHCMHIYSWFLHSSVGRHLGCFLLWAIVRSTAVDMCIHVYIWILFIFLFYLFIFWLPWVFVAAHGLSLVAASRSYFFFF